MTDTNLEQRVLAKFKPHTIPMLKVLKERRRRHMTLRGSAPLLIVAAALALLLWKFIPYRQEQHQAAAKSYRRYESVPCRPYEPGCAEYYPLASKPIRRLLYNFELNPTDEEGEEEESGGACKGPVKPGTGEGNSTPPAPLYPPDVFTAQQLADGAVILHVLGVVYMFVALALVCDEFFVPSLEVITEKLQLSDDVAGATFMAAGGSAPELFTNVVGVFFAHNDVGIGTIVGSAVFNILFVIGMCSIFSLTLLKLTWWPLFRDISFYSVSLLMLVYAFYDDAIEWYESLVLFLWYVVYAVFMRFNSGVETFVKAKLGLANESRKSEGCIKRYSVIHKLLPHEIAELHRASIVSSVDDGVPDFDGTVSPCSSSVDSVVPIPSSESSNDPKVHASSSKTGKHRWSNAGGKRSSDSTQYFDADEDDNQANNNHVPDSINTSKYRSNGSKNSVISYCCGPKLSTTSTEYFDAVEDQNRDRANNNVISAEEHNVDSDSEGSVSSEVRIHETESQVDAAAAEKKKSKSPSSGLDQKESKTEKGEAEEEDNSPLDMSWPETNKERLGYVLLFPLALPLWLTLPDVRREGSDKYFVISFVGSIMWIGGFSYLMVWWATVVGDTAGIPPGVMGLVFLACGTSVPDLLTSVAVARKGLGDMAVSSSVGSNLFDITVGLPVPWLIYHAINSGHNYGVSSEGIICSVFLLFAMLVAVVVSIVAFKWQMPNALGYVMIGLYAVFLVFALLLNYRCINCPPWKTD